MLVHLGVVDVAYTENDTQTTTGKVAEILEANYGVMRTFVELHEDEIADELGNQLIGMLESAKQGKLSEDYTDHLIDIHFPKVEAMFRNYLDSAEWERTSGQPTQAALMGVRHTHKRPYANGKGPRPSFIDTGLYRASFRTWVSK